MRECQKIQKITSFFNLQLIVHPVHYTVSIGISRHNVTWEISHRILQISHKNPFLELTKHDRLWHSQYVATTCTKCQYKCETITDLSSAYHQENCTVWQLGHIWANLESSLGSGRRRGKARIEPKIEPKSDIKKSKKAKTEKKVPTAKKENNSKPKEVLCPCCWEAVTASSLQSHFFKCANSMEFL